MYIVLIKELEAYHESRSLHCSGWRETNEQTKQNPNQTQNQTTHRNKQVKVTQSEIVRLFLLACVDVQYLLLELLL